MDNSIDNVTDNGVVNKTNGMIRGSWILLILSWIFLFVPFFGWLGWILSFVVFILSIIIIAKGEYISKGVLFLLLSILGSGLIYWISWMIIGVAGTVGQSVMTY